MPARPCAARRTAPPTSASCLHQRTKQLKAASETPLRYGWYLPELHQEVLRLRQVRKSLPLRRTQARGYARRPDPPSSSRPGSAASAASASRACSNSGIDGMKLRPAHHPRPGERLQMQQDPLRPTAASPIAAEQLRGHLLGLPHQAPHQAGVRRRPQPAPGSGSPSARPARQRRRPQRPLPQSWPLKMPQMLPVPPQPKRQQLPSLPHLPPPARATAVSVAETASAPKKD